MVVSSSLKKPEDFIFTFGDIVAMSANGDNEVTSALTKTHYIFYSHKDNAYIVEPR